MTSTGSGTPEEREVKIRIADHAAIVQRLGKLGAVQRDPEHVEDDRLFDDAAGSLRAAGCALRVRVVPGSDGGRLTWKGPARVENGAKVREEIETLVTDAAALTTVLERLALKPTFRYQKHRRGWDLRGAWVCLDRTALGDHVEIEGTDETIADCARALGLESSEFETRSYVEMWRAVHGEDAPDMLLPPELAAE